MTTEEFSNEFDVLYNQVNSNQAASLDEYEKSVFLTKAQNELVLMYANPRGNKFVQGIDDAPDKQYDFSTLIVKGQQNLQNNSDGYDPRSFCVNLSNNMLFLLNESVYNPTTKTVYQVQPITYNDYTKLMQKPFKYPAKNVVWRLIANNTNRTTSTTGSTSESESTNHADQARFELIGYGLSHNLQYKYRYLRYPRPIILTSLENAGLTLNHENTVQDCELPQVMHQQVLQRAVELATAVYNPQALGNLVGVGNASATNLGVVQSNRDN